MRFDGNAMRVEMLHKQQSKDSIVAQKHFNYIVTEDQPKWYIYIYIYINPPYPTLDFVLGLVPENSEVPQEAVALETEGGT